MYASVCVCMRAIVCTALETSANMKHADGLGVISHNILMCLLLHGAGED